LLPAQSRRRSGLEAMARIAFGKPQESASTQPPPSPPGSGPTRAWRRGATTPSAVVNEPSDRLFLAVMRMPAEAARIRPQLVDMQRTMGAAHIEALSDWMRRFDQALAAGAATTQASSVTL